MRRCSNKGGRAFTLVELLATVVIIAILVAITIGVANYVQRRIAIGTAKSQVAAMQAAIEMYKSDWGYYPATGPGRISINQACEGSNNLVLYRALKNSPRARPYMTFPAGVIRTNMHLPTGISQTEQLGIFDPWGKLYNYYNSPTTPYSNWQPTNSSYNGYTLGGQVNIASYDLFSYGPDGATLVPGCLNGYSPATGYGWVCPGYVWANTNSALDDITNWKQ